LDSALRDRSWLARAGPRWGPEDSHGETRVAVDLARVVVVGLSGPETAEAASPAGAVACLVAVGAAEAARPAGAVACLAAVGETEAASLAEAVARLVADEGPEVEVANRPAGVVGASRAAEEAEGKARVEVARRGRHDRPGLQVEAGSRPEEAVVPGRTLTRTWPVTSCGS